MDLGLGHGFIPRIGEENYKAVERCVGPADLFNPDPLDLPWAVIDRAWAEGRPELLNTLRNHGTKLLVDTHGWRGTDTGQPSTLPSFSRAALVAADIGVAR